MRALTPHHWRQRPPQDCCAISLGFFPRPSFTSYLIYFSLLLSSVIKKAKTRNKITYSSNFPPPFSIHNIFIDFPVMTNFFCGWLCNTETKMNTHTYFTTFHISVCIFYNSSSVKFFFCLHFKVIIDSFKILWSCKDKSVTCRSLVSSMWLHLRWMRREIKPRKPTLAHCSSLNCSVLVVFYPSLLYVFESVGL